MKVEDDEKGDRQEEGRWRKKEGVGEGRRKWDGRDRKEEGNRGEKKEEKEMGKAWRMWISTVQSSEKHSAITVCDHIGNNRPSWYLDPAIHTYENEEGGTEYSTQ